MTEDTLRLFSDDAAVVHVGEGLLARTLPRPEWTHEAHLAASLWIARERPEIDPTQDLAAIISAYNDPSGALMMTHRAITTPSRGFMLRLCACI